MAKPSFAPIALAPGFYFEILDVSTPSATTGPMIPALIGQGSKTANRIEQFTRAAVGTVEGPLTQGFVIDIFSIIDQNNITYAKNVDFYLDRQNDGTVKVNWGLYTSVVSQVAFDDLAGGVVALQGKNLVFTLNGHLFSIAFDNTVTNAAQVIAFINAWGAEDNQLITPSTLGPGASIVTIAGKDYLKIQEKTISILGTASANTLFFTSAMPPLVPADGSVEAPAAGVKYNVYYTSDKLDPEYAPQLLSNMNSAIGLYGPLRAQVSLDSGTVSGAGTGTYAGTGLLADASKTWTADSFIGNYLKVVSGPGAGQVRVIYSNTDTQLKVSQDWNAGEIPTSASTYVITDINNNTLVLGAKCLTDANGGSLFIMSQAQDDLFDELNYKRAILALEQPVSSVDPSCEVLMVGLTASSAPSIMAFSKSHVQRISDKLHTKVRVMIFGMAQNNNNFLTYSNIASGTQERRITLVAPSQVKKDFGQGLVNLDGSYVAAALAGIYCDPRFNAGEPIFRKSMGGVFDTGTFSDPFLEIEKIQLQTIGVTVIERQGVDLVVRLDLTTDQSTDLSSRLKYQRVADFTARFLQTNLDKAFTGKRFTRNIRPLALTFLRILAGQLVNNPDGPIIDHFDNEDAFMDPIQKSQLDYKISIYVEPDVVWQFLSLSAGV